MKSTRVLRVHSPSKPVDQLALLGPLLALTGIVVAVITVFLGAPRLAHGSEATPEEVLEQESRHLRQHLMDANGFIDRMEAYKGYSQNIREVNDVIEPVRPILAEFQRLKPYLDMGLLDMLVDADSDLQMIKPLLEGIVTANETLDRLGMLGTEMGGLTTDIDLLLTKPVLTVEDMQSLRTSIPAGQEALKNAGAAYLELKPTLDQLEGQLLTLRKEIDAQMGRISGMLGGGDLTRELKAALDMTFGMLLGVKGDLDAMANNVSNDVATLEALKSQLLSAEAHHAFALAQMEIADGKLEQAEQTLQLLVETYPDTEWAGKAEALLATGLESTQATLSNPDKDSPGVVWLLVVMGVTLAGAAGFVVYTRRREQHHRDAAA